jgi:hypothetical protein
LVAGGPLVCVLTHKAKKESLYGSFEPHSLIAAKVRIGETFAAAA